MKLYFFLFSTILIVSSCNKNTKLFHYSAVDVEIIFEDSVSIRAIELVDSSTLIFAGNNGIYGTLDLSNDIVQKQTITHGDSLPEFRAVSHNNSNFFILSVADPALLYKIDQNNEVTLVYKEEGEDVFYDAMKFWNNTEGIAIGDTRNGCLSIIITRDGGNTWNKLPCAILPKAVDKEGAFAASNTNIEIVGNKTWVATSSGRIYSSNDKGNTWRVTQTPMVSKAETEGIYSIDFYDDQLGFGYGGDYTTPQANIANKIITTDGGVTWEGIADGQAPGYKSCVQFMPNSNGKDIVAIGFTGISYSHDGGQSWVSLSKEGFYTLRFLNNNTAIAAGKNRIARLSFR